MAGEFRFKDCCGCSPSMMKDRLRLEWACAAQATVGQHSKREFAVLPTLATEQVRQLLRWAVRHFDRRDIARDTRVPGTVETAPDCSPPKRSSICYKPVPVPGEKISLPMGEQRV